MIVVKTDKIYCLYARTNRRVKWRYAQYGGRYETIEDAINTVKEYFKNERVEFLIENLEDDTEIQGFVN